MRRTSVAVTALSFLAAPVAASAGTIVQTVPLSPVIGDFTLNPVAGLSLFNAPLGTVLTGVTAEIKGSLVAQFDIAFTTPPPLSETVTPRVRVASVLPGVSGTIADFFTTSFAAQSVTPSVLNSGPGGTEVQFTASTVPVDEVYTFTNFSPFLPAPGSATYFLLYDSTSLIGGPTNGTLSDLSTLNGGTLTLTYTYMLPIPAPAGACLGGLALLGYARRRRA